MEASFYIRVFVYVTLVSVMVSVSNKEYKKGLIAWRIGSAFVILDFSTMLFYSEALKNRVFTILLFIQCFLSMPILSQISTCCFCGHRTYWHMLISNKCPHCGKKCYD